MIEFNPDSPKQLATLFFGGEVKYIEKHRMRDEEGNPITIKSGQNAGHFKLKNYEIVKNIQGLGLKPHPAWKTDKGNISLNDKVLKVIAKKKQKEAAKIASLILEMRKLQKEIGTYYEGMEELVMDWDNCIHGQFSHCGYGSDEEARGGTTTGRLSSHKPNLQNLPRS